MLIMRLKCHYENQKYFLPLKNTLKGKYCLHIKKNYFTK